MKKAAIAILFIVIVLFLQLLLNGTLTRTGNGQWIEVANIIWGLIFWLGLWRLSNAGYENRRGPARWIGLSGLAKAFLTLGLAIILSCIGLAIYSQVFFRVHYEMFQLADALESFDGDYGKYPGPAGPITREMVDELRGSPSARINTKRTDYLQPTEVYNPFLHTWPGTANYYEDPWGHPFYLRLYSPDPNHKEIVNFDVISSGPNGEYEDGGGDDITYQGLGH